MNAAYIYDLIYNMSFTLHMFHSSLITSFQTHNVCPENCSQTNSKFLQAVSLHPAWGGGGGAAANYCAPRSGRGPGLHYVAYICVFLCSVRRN